MNEFILEEKHKYWDNKITLKEYIKDIEESGYIDCTGDYEYEYWYILENLKKLNNLQSKIDKIIKLCETEKNYTYGDVRRDENTGKLIYGNKIELDVVNKSKILDILKEDK